MLSPIVHSLFLAQPGQVLQDVPVGQAVGLGCEQGVGRGAVLGEVLGKAALPTGEIDEGERLFGLGIDVPIGLDIGVALEIEAFADGVAPPRIVDQQGEGAAVHGGAGALRGFMVADAMFGLAGGIDADHRRAAEFVRFHDRPVEMVDVRGGGLGYVHIGVHHGDLGQLFAALALAQVDLAEGAHLGALAGEGGGGTLAAGVGIDLRIQHQHFDVHAAGQHAAERAEADVDDGAIAADDPQALVVPAQLIPARAYAHGIGGAVLEQGVGPGDGPGVVGVGAAIDGGAAGGVDDADVLAAHLEGGGGQPHAQGGGLAAAGAGAGPAHVAQGLILQHHVHQHAVVDEAVGGGRQAAEEIESLFIAGDGLLLLFDHFQGVVAQIRADLHTLGATFAFGGVDEDAEEAAAARFFLFGHAVEFVGLGPLLAQPLPAGFGHFCQRLLQRRRLDHPAEDGGVGAFGDAGHAAHAVGVVEFGDFGGDVGEIAERAGAGRDERAGHAQIRGQLIIAGHVVGADHALVEVLDVAFEVELEDGGFDAHGVGLFGRPRLFDQRAQPRRPGRARVDHLGLLYRFFVN